MLSLWYWQLKTRTLKWCKNQPWTRYIPHENQFVIALFAGSPIYLSDFGSAVQLLPISYSISDMLMGCIYILSFPFSNKLFFFFENTCFVSIFQCNLTPVCTEIQILFWAQNRWKYCSIFSCNSLFWVSGANHKAV